MTSWRKPNLVSPIVGGIRIYCCHNPNEGIVLTRDRCWCSPNTFNPQNGLKVVQIRT